MAARLGNVLYWFCCAIAAGAVLVGATAFDAPQAPSDNHAIMIAFSIMAVLAFLIGRALRYVLAGR